MTSTQLSPTAPTTTRRSLIPARLDFIQSATGLPLLALFVGVQMLFLSSILVCQDKGTVVASFMKEHR